MNDHLTITELIEATESSISRYLRKMWKRQAQAEREIENGVPDTDAVCVRRDHPWH